MKKSRARAELRVVDRRVKKEEAIDLITRARTEVEAREEAERTESETGFLMMDLASRLRVSIEGGRDSPALIDLLADAFAKQQVRLGVLTEAEIQGRLARAGRGDRPDSSSAGQSSSASLPPSNLRKAARRGH